MTLPPPSYRVLDGQTFTVVREVGIGTFGRVLVCRPSPSPPLPLSGGGGQQQQQQQQFLPPASSLVAIKVIRAVRRYHDNAREEAAMLRRVAEFGEADSRAKTRIVNLFATFDFAGHYCFVTEFLGPSLYDVFKSNDVRSLPKAYPTVVVLSVARQMLDALDFLHSVAGLTHSDVKPENILFVDPDPDVFGCPPRPFRFKLVDFGSALLNPVHPPRPLLLSTRQYRAPELLCSRPWSPLIDVWSLGCVIAEVAAGRLLFETHDDRGHLLMVERGVGPLPDDWLWVVGGRAALLQDFARMGRKEKEAVENMRTIEEKVGEIWRGGLGGPHYEGRDSIVRIVREMLVIDGRKSAKAILAAFGH